MSARERPLSPHLQIYRPQLTSVLSITHRATGVVGSIGFVFLIVWLMTAAGESRGYAMVQEFAGSLLGRLVLVALSYSFFFHLCNGIRHLFWDIGKGFDIEVTYRTGWATVIASVVLTVALWVYALGGTA